MDSRWLIPLLGVCVALVHGSCYWGALEDADGPNPFCILETGERLYRGETVVTKDCYECSCSQYGLGCCGVGPYNKGPGRLPPDCEIVLDPEDHCKYTISCADK